MTFIESNRLMGKGIGLIDAHLLAAVALAANPGLWIHDNRLMQAAEICDWRPKQVVTEWLRRGSHGCPHSVFPESTELP